MRFISNRIFKKFNKLDNTRLIHALLRRDNNIRYLKRYVLGGLSPSKSSYTRHFVLSSLRHYFIQVLKKNFISRMKCQQERNEGNVIKEGFFPLHNNAAREAYKKNKVDVATSFVDVTVLKRRKKKRNIYSRHRTERKWPSNVFGTFLLGSITPTSGNFFETLKALFLLQAEKCTVYCILV